MNYAPYMNPFADMNGMNPNAHPMLSGFVLAIILVLLVWTLVWKGLALWHAARNHQNIWFVVLLIVNTLGILEILYLLFFRKNKNATVHTTTVTHTTTTSTPAPAPDIISAPVAE